MTVQDVLNRIEQVKPHKYPIDAVVRWVSEVDSKVSNLHLGYGGDATDAPYCTEDLHKSVLLGDEWDRVYIYYVQAMIDYFNGESARYTNGMIMFNTAFQEYADFYARTRMHAPTKLKTSVDRL